jgi:hypothetical protein
MLPPSAVTTGWNKLRTPGRITLPLPGANFPPDARLGPGKIVAFIAIETTLLGGASKGRQRVITRLAAFFTCLEG